MISPQTYIRIAALLYLVALLVDLLPKRRNAVTLLFLTPAMACNLIGAALRYLPAWPMLPMYLGPILLPVFLGACRMLPGKNSGSGAVASRAILAMAAAVSVAAILFPKDFYLPFVKSQTPAAHLFLLFGTAGKGCFLAGSAWALEDLLRSRPNGGRSWAAATQSFTWNIWGFCLFTLSMFSGELWSYLGWGTPVVWDDPAITGVMATWFFYIGLLHLHLTGTWSVRSRSGFAVAGALIIMLLNIFPDLGPFRWPL